MIALQVLLTISVFLNIVLLSILYFKRKDMKNLLYLCGEKWKVEVDFHPFETDWGGSTPAWFRFLFSKDQFKRRTINQAMEIQKIIDNVGCSYDAKQLLESTIAIVPTEFKSVVD